MKFIRLLADHGEPYGSYRDLLRLVELSNFEMVEQNAVDIKSKEIYIAYCANGNVRNWLTDKRRTCKIILWQLERQLAAGDLDFCPPEADQVWLSDRWQAGKLNHFKNVRYVPIGGHPDLGCDPNDEKRFDLAPMGYIYGRRERIVNDLAKEYRIAPKAWPPVRDKVLATTRAGLCLHQHDNDPFIEPLRMTMFAMHHLPLVAEYSHDYYPYVVYPLNGISEALGDVRGYAKQNYRMLCDSLSFTNCINAAMRSFNEEN